MKNWKKIQGLARALLPTAMTQTSSLPPIPSPFLLFTFLSLTPSLPFPELLNTAGESVRALKSK